MKTVCGEAFIIPVPPAEEVRVKLGSILVKMSSLFSEVNWSMVDVLFLLTSGGGC